MHSAVSRISRRSVVRQLVRVRTKWIASGCPFLGHSRSGHTQILRWQLGPGPRAFDKTDTNRLAGHEPADPASRRERSRVCEPPADIRRQAWVWSCRLLRARVSSYDSGAGARAYSGLPRSQGTKALRPAGETADGVPTRPGVRPEAFVEDDRICSSRSEAAGPNERNTGVWFQAAVAVGERERRGAQPRRREWRTERSTP
jgi:hypothetical protein